jgi:hypothetical protein
MSAGPSNPKSNPYQASQQPNLEPAGLAPLGQLGSLSQSARLKSLNVARVILILIGVVLAILAGVDMSTMRDQVKELLNNQVQDLRGKGMVVDPVKLQEIEDRAVQVGWLIDSGFLAVAALFVVFGVIVKKYPVPITIAGLAVFLAILATVAFLNPQSLLSLWLWKLLAIVGLVKAVQSARAYEQERRAEIINADVAAGYGR